MVQETLSSLGPSKRVRYVIEVREVNGRLRAFMKDDAGRYLGSWWIESASHERYKPLKPVPPLAMFIINKTGIGSRSRW